MSKQGKRPLAPLAGVATASVLVLGLAAWRLFDTTSHPSEPPTESNPPTSASSLPSPAPEPVVGWRALAVAPLTSGPRSLLQVSSWLGGYLAIGGSLETGPRAAWVSADGLAWEGVLPPVLPAVKAFAVRCAEGVMILAQPESGDWTVATSGNGRDWTQRGAFGLAPVNEDDVAGAFGGVVAIGGQSPARVVFSDDCASWQPIALDGPPSSRISAVSRVGKGFVAVGDDGGNPMVPLAWWSADGKSWSQSEIEPEPGVGLASVFGANGGLIALGRTKDSITISNAWTSVSGELWLPAENPLQDELGQFITDGTRIVGYGRVLADGGPEQWLSSIDGHVWKDLRLSGALETVLSGQARPFLLAEGILFSDSQGAWYGLAAPDPGAT